MTPDFLTLPDRRLAYQRGSGDAQAPSIVFLGGYASDMTGTKASFLAERCAATHYRFLRFDYRGHGQSSGDFKDGAIGDWFEDVQAVVGQLTDGPQIVIGSSMGGWMGLMLAVQQPQRVKAFIGVAAAPDFTEDLMWAQLSADQRARLVHDGVIYDEGHAPVTLRLIEEGRQHLMLHQKMSLKCPVRLLQGLADADVPWQHAVRIADAIDHSDVRVTLVKDGDHRLSQPQDLDLLWQTVQECAAMKG